ncbi:Hypothetical predicted protein [Pelobates cultripes]|uniref:Uncharacterized protein n=1 Tax=Pelobates cultripes TaxID=61616 RepID=A0AAD1S5M8_PELCU|nr:Hypothetical predicted protein [Pelobates cultripes]
MSLSTALPHRSSYFVIKTQIPSTPFKDQVSEDVTLEDNLDLEMSITSANCSLRKAGSTLSLGAAVKVVSESLGVLVSAPATQIPSTPFKDQVSEDVTLEDNLDLEMSITSANCSLRKAGSTLSLGAAVKVVSESLGVLVSAPANAQVGISLNATKLNIGVNFHLLSDFQLNNKSTRSSSVSSNELVQSLVNTNLPNLVKNMPSLQFWDFIGLQFSHLLEDPELLFFIYDGYATLNILDKIW